MDGLIKKVDGSAEIFLEHKYEIAKGLQDRKHICGVIGDGLSMIMGTVFTNHTDYGMGVQQAQWATAQRTLHGLNESFDDNRGRHELSKLAEQAANTCQDGQAQGVGHVQSVRRNHREAQGP